MLTRFSNLKRMALTMLFLILLNITITTALAAPDLPTAPVSEPAFGQAAGGLSLEDWNGWGHDLLNTRFNPFTTINRANVSQLKLKWAFAFPGALATSNQPAVVDGTLYVGSWNGHFYALDARTGQQKWDFDTTSFTGVIPPGTLPPGFSNGVRNSPVVAGGLVYFGDILGDLYAVEAATGHLRWAKPINGYGPDRFVARLTSSPVVYQGRLYQGVSSSETGFALDPIYPCCTFRGSMVALDAATGQELWRYYTVPQPQPTGTNSVGTTLYGPSGAPIWSSPAIDPLSKTLYFGTGQNYSLPTSDRSDAVIALDLATGQEKWHNQLTPNDRWTIACDPTVFGFPPGAQPNCPQPSANDRDFDLGAAPSLFVAFDKTTHHLRSLVGIGQKSGVYHVLDAATGQIVWQDQLGLPTVKDGLGGIQWGSAWDGERLYVTTNQAAPGQLFALDPATGQILWHTPNPADGCSTGGAIGSSDCKLALPAPATMLPGLIMLGSADGKLRAYDNRDGRVVWTYDTVRNYTGTTNGVTGRGGSINGSGVTVAGGMAYVQTGYQAFLGAGMAGNVLLAFGF